MRPLTVLDARNVFLALDGGIRHPMSPDMIIDSTNYSSSPKE